jgi:hypothetical protein
MKAQLRGFLQILFLLGFVLLLIRFFPIMFRLLEAAAIGIREFWWAVLVITLGVWLVWVLRKRNSG